MGRRKAEELIAAGRVRVNGVTVSDQGVRASLTEDRIEVDGETLSAPSENRYIVLNKPRKVLTTRSDDRGRTTVMELLPPELSMLFPVGRLDFDSEGMLLLTNDGEWANHVIHPRYGVEKEYLVATARLLSTEECRRLISGVELEDGVGRFVSIREIPASGPGAHPPFQYSVIVEEGRNRFIRRMIDAFGTQVVRLKRIRIGRMELGSVREGEFHDLTPDQILLLGGGSQRGA
jgi:23S rRNA pseudouridine2605 synthase